MRTGGEISPIAALQSDFFCCNHHIQPSRHWLLRMLVPAYSRPGLAALWDRTLGGAGYEKGALGNACKSTIDSLPGPQGWKSAGPELMLM